MKSLKLLAFILLLPLGVIAQTTFHGIFTGGQEVPSVQTMGFGTIEANLDGNILTLSGSFENLLSPVATQIAGGVHIHSGASGTNGPVVFSLDSDLDPNGRGGTFGSATNTFELSAEEMEMLQNRELYVNIHSEKYPSGELRSQLLPASDHYFQATLSGNQEVPAVLSSAEGLVMLELSGNQLILSGSFANLTTPLDPNIAMGAHIHSGMPGENGGVEIVLNPTVDPDGLGGSFSPSNNTYTLDSETMELLENRQLYVNIHTEGLPGGEIRGQITALATSTWRAHLSGANERPFVDSRGHGMVLAEYQAWENTITLFGSFADLESEVAIDIAGGAHIHAGFAGQNGPVVTPLEIEFTSSENKSGKFNSESNTFILDEDQTEMLHNRMLYVNIHTLDNQPGELRGQLLPLSNYHFSAYAGGSQEVPSVVTSGSGAVKVEWTAGEIVVSGSFDGLGSPVNTSIAGGAHLHLGMPGENGSVLLALNITLGPDSLSGEFRPENNTFEIDESIENAIANRSTYLNIHTLNFPMGEIRGQVLREAQGYYQSNLSGSQEVPAVLTTGRGLLLFERSMDEIIPVGSFSNLSGEYDVDIAGGAHIHRGFAGQNGGIVTSLLPVIDQDLLGGQWNGSESVEIDEEFWQMLNERSLYVNVHTKTFAPGEIRGQITGLNSSLFRAHLAGVNEVPAVETSGQGAILAELDNNGRIIVSGSFENIESPLAQHIAGGVHLHLGLAGQNGPVEIALVADLTGADQAVFNATKNTFELNERAVSELLNRAVYANVHTDDYPAGELRGQLMGDAQYVFTSVLSGQQEVPSVVSSGYGMVKTEWNNGQVKFSGSASNLLEELADHIAGGVHLHLGMPGENGGVVLVLDAAQMKNELDLYDLTFDAIENTFAIDEGLEQSIANRQSYINIHTLAYEAGELRGQVVREALGYYFSNLYGSHEFPSVYSNGMGAVQLEWYGDWVEAFGSFSGLMSAVDTSIAGGVHIHTGLPGENGPVTVILNPNLSTGATAGSFTAENNSIETDMDFVRAIRDRKLYVNLHSIDFPSGELRGQLSGPSTGIMRAYLRGAEENPQVISTGGGAVLAELKPDFSVNYYGSFRNLTSDLAVNIAGGIHLHTGLPGENGPVVSPLENTTSPQNRAGELPNQRVELDTMAFMSKVSRATYINIHSEDFPSGEIRGQFLGECQYVYTGIFSGLQEVNPVATLATGTVFAEKSGDALIVTGALFNLLGEVDADIAGGAHLHMGYPGENGDVVLLLNISDMGNDNYHFLPLENKLEINTDLADLLSMRQIYANVHTDLHQGGEARAQLMGEAKNYYIANLSGSHEVPPVRTPASGTVILEDYETEVKSVGSFAGLQSDFDREIAGGAHIHSGLTGMNGPIERGLDVNLRSGNRSGFLDIEENVFSIDRSLLYERKLYVNIHTMDHPSGELRGTLIPIQMGAFTAHLDGRNEVSPVMSNAIGQALVEFNGVELVVSGAFNNLSSPLETDIAGGAHIHMGMSDENGGVIYVLNVDITNSDSTSGQFNTAENKFDLDDPNDIWDLLNGTLYFNVHSKDIPSGEIRGQILPVINFFPAQGPQIINPADGGMITIEGAPETPFDISWNEVPADEDIPFIYHWEISLDPDFNESLIYLNSGSSTSISFTFKDIRDLLEENGIMIGETVELYHRAITSDGSLRTPGESSSVHLTRGTLTNIRNVTDIQRSVNVFPNPLNTGLNPTIEIQTDSEELVRLQLIDATGKLIYLEELQLTSGSNTVQPNFNFNNSGIYFISITDNDNRSIIRRISIVD